MTIAAEQGMTQRFETLNKSTIADLTADAINGMTSDELAQVIRAAELPTHSHVDLRRHLRMYDCETLRRWAHLARRFCQLQG